MDNAQNWINKNKSYIVCFKYMVESIVEST
nr:MAG TPA: hypothetical protein [Herelleviridae sp.]